METFDFLLANNIGMYNKCEVIEILGFNTKQKDFFNIYTLVVFENTSHINIEGLITEKLEKFLFTKGIKWGIKRKIIDIDSAKSFYNTLMNEDKFITDNKEVLIGKLKYLDMQYIQPKDSFTEQQLNYLIKNNFYNGSYILEFFDESKKDTKFLIDNPDILNDFSKRISEILPINIGSTFDRLGNVIFQFPINAFTLNYTTTTKGNPKRYTGIEIEISPKNNSFKFQNLEIRVFEENDNIITRQNNKTITNNITKISLDDCFGTTIEIIDKNTSLLLYKNKFTIMKEMNLQINLMNSQDRVFELNKVIKKVSVSHNTNNNISKKFENYKKFHQWTTDRKYEQELKYLEQKKSFIQYYGKKDEDKKALEDIKFLINTYGEDGVYLWDPYLGAIDIKNTLYFSKSSYVNLKAITGLKQGSSYVTNIIRKLKWSTSTDIVNKVILLDFQYHLNIFNSKSQKQQAINEIKLELNKDEKKFLFLNLEVRGKHGTNGYDFHDRFLIFPQEKPKVWSLGISVNQLGKAHHILQEVKNAQHILNAFNQLWNELDKRECLVWKSN